ncbi:MAG: glycosyltransferase, partial [Armatimonadetes bacterium]|nr:glycosyltransferase [Armatimonadota bacterium]
MPEVTVLMAVHNGMPYLPAAVESILGQTYAGFEFLIIDD